jgi:hypothetical protein
MPLLNGKAVFFIERHLFSQAACANGVGAVIEQHVPPVGLERFRAKSTMPARRCNHAVARDEASRERGLLQSHHDAVDRTAAIHNGEPHEARPFRLE